MLQFLNNIFRTVRNKLGKIPFLVPKNNTNGVYTMTEDVVTPEEKKERSNRKARIKARTHKFTLNRSDRRFLYRILGEDYPAGSKTHKVLWQRVQDLKRSKISVAKKRLVASRFLLHGSV